MNSCAKLNTIYFSELALTKPSTNTGHLSKSDISEPYPQSRNLREMNTQQASNIRPLPPVPHYNQ